MLKIIDNHHPKISIKAILSSFPSLLCKKYAKELWMYTGNNSLF